MGMILALLLAQLATTNCYRTCTQDDRGQWVDGALCFGSMRCETLADCLKEADRRNGKRLRPVVPGPCRPDRQT